MSRTVIKLDVNEKCAKDMTCHLLPCKINYNGTCNVSKYFTPYVTENSGLLNCSLRGHPLDGQEVSVPDGYQGVVLKEIQKLSSNEEKELQKTGTFKKFTFWNWDKKPSSSDKLIKALDWTEVASFLHKPVVIEMNSDKQECNGFKTQVKRKHCDSDD